MTRIAILAVLLASAASAHGSWYWPFGSDSDEKRVPRLSELMEGASTNIDAAVDFAEDGKTSEAIEAYRRALAELDRVEMENPERAKLPEFATLRNKRAYVSAAIDSLLLEQVKANAKVVAVSDTTELERRFAAEKAAASGKAEKPPAAAEKPPAEAEKPPAEAEKPPAAPAKESAAAAATTATATAAAAATTAKQAPRSLRDRIISDIEKGDWAAADLGIREMLSAKPNDAVALNLKAALAMEQGRLKEAENALDQAIMSNPRCPYSYYNMADLMLKRDPPNNGAARRYYETGRAMGGARDERLEALAK